MRLAGAPRRELLVSMAANAPQPIIDVGADHGYVAAELGAIATERMPHRANDTRLRWVVADGLAAFREVTTAIIAGMGANTIAGILERGPRPAVAILHAQDSPPTLRRWLADNGWRIVDERLAPEARGFAEVIRAEPGVESATGLELHYGPRLLAGADPHLKEHLKRECNRQQGIARATANRDLERHRDASERVEFLQGVLESLETG